MNLSSTKLDLSYLDKVSHGDSNTKKRILKMLVEGIEGDLPRLRQLCKAEDWDQVAHFCHHFKSTLIFSGNNTMLNANKRIWDHAEKQGQTSTKVDVYLKALEANSNRVVREANNILKKL